MGFMERIRPNEPGAEASDLADVAGSVASKATATEDPRVCNSTDWQTAIRAGALNLPSKDRLIQVANSA